MNLLLIGAPGVGKGTVSSYLIEKHSFKHISTGDILREAVANQTKLGLQVKEFMDKGALVPDETIIDLVKETLKNIDTTKGLIFDGFPRTVAQAIALENLLKELNLKLDKAVVLEVEKDVLVKRITGRRVCSKCKSLYNIYYKAPQTEGKCDICGGDLYTRNDDNLESLEKRLSEYHINAEPLISFYEKQGIVEHFNADQSRDKEIISFEEILKGMK